MKKSFSRTLLAAAALAAFSGSLARAQPPLPESAVAPATALGNALAAVADHSKNFVVSILSEKMVKLHNDAVPLPFQDPFFRKFFGMHPELPPGGVPVHGLGSGFVLDKNGHILTNYHVVAGMSEIRVVLPDKESFPARILGADPKSDVAVLQLQGDYPKNLEDAPLGNSDSLRPGHLVMAFGAPFGLTRTVTNGIVSATGRSNVGIADFEDFIQTDAPINPGNSGGPLVNMRGQVIGINTAIATGVGQSAGVGFAIPINMVKDILPTLLQGKQVVRGMLGVGVQDLTPTLNKEFNVPGSKGALVSQVNPGSPAQQAGLREGDVIIGYDGRDIGDSTQLRDLVSRTRPGTREELTVLRDGKRLRLMATLGRLGTQAVAQAAVTAPVTPKTSLGKFGIEARTLTPGLKSRYRLKQQKGIVITSVNPLSSASMAGLQPGDVISQVDRKPVDSVHRAEKILARTSTPHQVVLLVHHGGTALYVGLQTG